MGGGLAVVAEAQDVLARLEPRGHLHEVASADRVAIRVVEVRVRWRERGLTCAAIRVVTARAVTAGGARTGPTLAVDADAVLARLALVRGGVGVVRPREAARACRGPALKRRYG